MKKQNFILIIGAIVLIIAIIVSIHLTQRPALRKQVITIGAILPLTGPASPAGEFQKNGIEVAVEQINSQGGINGKNLIVEYGDSKNEGKEGLSIFRKMVDVQKIPLIVATHSGVVTPIANQLSEKDETFLLISISSVPGVTKFSPYIFRYFVTSENESQKMAIFAFNQLNVRRAAVFYINDEFGLGGSRTFKKSFSQLGGNVIVEEAYEKGGTDFRNTLTKITGNTDIEALYIIGYDKAFAIAVKQAREIGFKNHILTSIGMSVPEWLNLVGPKAEGIYLTATRFEPDLQDAHVQKFTKEFNNIFSKDPNMMSAFMYDCINMLAQAIQNNGYSASGVKKWFESLRNYPGVIGDVSFDKTREGNPELVIRRIVNGKPRIIEE